VERTFLAIKPDGVQRQLVGDIIRRFEAKGFTLVGLKLIQVSKDLAAEHYGEHKEKPFFPGLVEFITSGPVVAMVWEGKGVVAAARKMIGVTNPLNSEPGTIRGDYGVDVGRNIIHGSDAVETAQREIALWFQPSELMSWTPTLTRWIYE
jgi:nucleoside-diphosphate kinase